MKALALALMLGGVGSKAGFLGTATPPLRTAICQPGGCVLLGRQTLQTELGLTFTEHRVAVPSLKDPLRFGVDGQGQIQWAEVSVSGPFPAAAELSVLVRFVQAATGRWVNTTQVQRCLKSARQNAARSVSLIELDRAGVVCVASGPNGPFKLAASLGLPH
ncbi:hypothetical protein K7W42_18200 [Deinococcus sp. HMF7604]|uniref:hypothetical protein n=1 Tax=Deinococcus betulae TaxID=2873312 RepID=UPI001CC98C3A|nr:hypothetical protein [Deinococcus betulae]MBZ9752775.1 hypothetical protein [Deinococcus betulae]